MLHGTQKLFGYPPNPPGRAAGALDTLLTVGAGIELIGGLLIMVGLFASIAAFISSGMMAVAYFMAHQPQGAWPPTNGGDAAVLYCFIFLYIASRGSGVWSIESLFKGSGSAAANGG